MLIVSTKKINNLHIIEEQSWRKEVWQDGYIEVPYELHDKVLESGGYCDLVIEGGELLDIISLKKPFLPQERILQIQLEMAENDYKQFKYLRGEMSESEWREVKAWYADKIAEINELENY